MAVAEPNWMMLLCLGVTFLAVVGLGVAVLVASLLRRRTGGDLAQRVAALERAVRRLEDERDDRPALRSTKPPTDIRE
jgi:hypothetical protein